MMKSKIENLRERKDLTTFLKTLPRKQLRELLGESDHYVNGPPQIIENEFGVACKGGFDVEKYQIYQELGRRHDERLDY